MSGVDEARAALDNAVSAGEPPDLPPSDPAGRGPGLPEGCPVTPLGAAGAKRWYLDELGQLQELAPRDHTRLSLVGLYGRRPHLLPEHWPEKDDDGKPTGNFLAGRAAQELMAAAAACGILNLNDRVRGPGAWPGEGTDQVILHCGDVVLDASGNWRPCGVIGRHIYPAYPAIPRPSEVFAPAGPRGPGQELLNLFRDWAWRRPDIDPELMVGFIACQLMGGALSWRPTVWIAGERGFGKSALHGAIRMVHGEGGAIVTADATEAGLRQTLKFASLPVLFDEMEPGEDPRKAAAVIGLARRASSGSISLRGSAGHQEHEFAVRSAFLFSSILLPPLSGAERSRIAILDLMPLGRRTLPDLQPMRLRALGAALRRRLLDHWPRFTEVWAAYRGALMEGGHDARGADLYGVLLAGMDLLLFERSGFDPGELDEWAARLPPGGGESLDVDEPDHQRCLTHLLSAPIDAYRAGTRRTVGQWVADALGNAGDQPRAGNAILETYGLKVAARELERGVRQPGIYVATGHIGLSAIFLGTHWGGGGSKSAPWSQALRRIPGAEAGSSQRFGGAVIKTTWVPACAWEVADAA